MATASGIAAQLGFKTESTYGTPVTVDRFLPFRSETWAETVEHVMADDIIAGSLTAKQEQIRVGNRAYAGTESLYLYNRNIAILWKMLLGGNVTTGSGPYVHTITPGNLAGLSTTRQIGRPDNGGTVRPFTFSGAKVARIGLAVTAGEYATMDVDYIAQDMTTGTALATASYPASLARFHANDLAVTIGGSAVCVRNLDIEVSNAFDDTRRCVGSAIVKEPLRNELVTVSGSMEIEWSDLTHYARMAALTYATVVITFTKGTDVFALTTNVHFPDVSQPVAGRGVVYQTLQFEGSGAATDAQTITVAITNADSAA